MTVKVRPLELPGGGGRGIQSRVLGATTDGALEVGDQAAFGARHDLDELPALLAPVVEDRCGVVDEEGGREVFPRGHLRLLGVEGVNKEALIAAKSAAHAGASVKGSPRYLPYDLAYA